MSENALFLKFVKRKTSVDKDIQNTFLTLPSSFFFLIETHIISGIFPHLFENISQDFSGRADRESGIRFPAVARHSALSAVGIRQHFSSDETDFRSGPFGSERVFVASLINVLAPTSTTAL